MHKRWVAMPYDGAFIVNSCISFGTLSKPIPMANHLPKSLIQEETHHTKTRPGADGEKEESQCIQRWKHVYWHALAEKRNKFKHIVRSNYPLREGVLNY